MYESRQTAQPLIRDPYPIVKIRSLFTWLYLCFGKQDYRETNTVIA